ncbi:copper resistance protein B [Luteimonas aestuarii]|uniref:Copper resistance protein B n=1 Tax=Luteimonas aestuarii TaxID=453837 RepID=A0A4R5TVQ5_9GAMM|nr:copper resistance protein B [Luteimonas aestuarii]
MGHCTLPDASVQAHGQHEPASSRCTPEHAAMGHCQLSEAENPLHEWHAEPDAFPCTPEHAAMGHCTLPDAPVQTQGQHGPVSSGCTPEHAAMGHCRMEAPREPRTPIPVPTEADIAAAFPALHHHSMEHASPVNYMVLFDRLEAWDADDGSGQGWEAIAWIGTDLDRLWLRSGGEREGGRTGTFDVEALYGRSVLPWWDVVAGVRQELRPRSRTWAALGVQGLAPYMFEVSATAYAGSGGQVQVKVEAEYDMRFTNRLILQPVFEASVALKDEPMEGIGSGLGGIEAGLRLRYEISRRFAPYIGVVHERAYGNTADYLRAAGGHARDTRVVAGVRLWF